MLTIILFIWICFYPSFGPLNTNSLIDVSFSLLFIITSLMPFCSYGSIRKGYLVQWIYWIFIPGWPFIIRLIRFPYKDILSYLRSLTFRNIWRTITSLFTLEVVIKTAIFAVAIYAILAFLFISSIVKSIKMFPEWLMWKRWSKRSQKSLSCPELYALIKNFHYRPYHLRVLKYVREYYLLVPTKETEKALEKLALEMEVYLRSKKKVVSKCPILVKNANYEILDEIYLLLENIRFSLHGDAVCV